MNEVWNLDPLYKGFDDPAFEADMNAVEAKISEKSFEEAYKLIVGAAPLMSICGLVYAYASGTGVDQDKEEAIRLLTNTFQI